MKTGYSFTCIFFFQQFPASWLNLFVQIVLIKILHLLTDKYRTKVKRLLILFSYQSLPILDRILLKIIHASILRKDFTVIFIARLLVISYDSI